MDDKDIGYHSFRVTERGDHEEVEIEAQFDVRFLFFNAYSYRHNNVERWENDCLREIRSTTRAGSDQFRLVGQARSASFEIETQDDRFDLDEGCVRSFSYWDPLILESSRLLNAQTGEWLEVAVQLAGEERIDVQGRSIPAQRYDLRLPDGTISLWYGAGDQWLALQAPAPGGRVLRYLPERLPAAFDEVRSLASR
jgi:hypothetical protein